MTVVSNGTVATNGPNGARTSRSPRRAFGDDFTSPFVPIGVTPAYPPPKNNIGRDRSKSWLKRALPIVLAHKGIFISSLVISFIGLIFQVQIPNEVGAGDRRRAEEGRHAAQPVRDHPRGARLAALRVQLLLAPAAPPHRVPHRVRPPEHRLRAPQPHVVLVLRPRAVGSAHLAGELRHPRRADVPVAGAVHPRAVQRRRSSRSSRCCRSTSRSRSSRSRRCRSCSSPASRCAREMFPVSWLIQARLADVATVVDENIQGVRVVKSFAAENEQLRTAHRKREARRVGEHRAGRDPLAVRAAHREPAAARPGARPALRRLPRDQRAGDGRRHRRVQRLRAHARAAVPSTRLRDDDGPAGGGVGAAHLRGARRAARHRRPSGRGRPRRVHGRRRSSTTSTSTYAQRHAGARPTSSCTCARARRSRSSAAPAPASPPSRACSRASTTSPTARCGSTVTTCATSRCRACATTSAWCSTTRSCSRCRSATTSPTGGPTRRSRTIEAAAIAAGADDFIRELPEGYDTVVGERGFTLSGGQRQRISIARTLLVNPPILMLDDATSAIDVQIEQQIHAALSRLMTGRTTLIIAHRLSTISLADRVAVVEDGRIDRRRAPTRSCSRPSRATSRSSPRPKQDDDEPRRVPRRPTATAMAQRRCSSTRSTVDVAETAPPRRRSRHRHLAVDGLRRPTREGSTDGLGRRRDVRRRRMGGGRWAAGRRAAPATACRSPASRRSSRPGSRSCSRPSPTGRRRTRSSRTGSTRARRHAAHACSARTGACSRSRSCS